MSENEKETDALGRRVWDKDVRSTPPHRAPFSNRAVRVLKSARFSSGGDMGSLPFAAHVALSTDQLFKPLRLRFLQPCR
jgi:hypothetical protein